MTLVQSQGPRWSRTTNSHELSSSFHTQVTACAPTHIHAHSKRGLQNLWAGHNDLCVESQHLEGGGAETCGSPWIQSSLSYIENSRPARTTKWELVSKQNRNNKIFHISFPQLFLLSPFLCLLHRTTRQLQGVYSSALSSNSPILSSLAPPLFESIHLVFETA